MRKSMLAGISLGLAATRPSTQQALWRWWYNKLAVKDSQELLLMNYGFCNNQALDLLPGEEPYRYPLQLYRHVIEGVDLRAKVILEAGCGRGGGLMHIHNHCHPSFSVGIDLSQQAARRAEKELASPGLKFLCGDVQNLPIKSQSIQVGINVESSHCYPHFKDFLSEMARVLVPRGVFCFADFRAKGDINGLEESLQNNFSIESYETINDFVLQALDKVSKEREAKIKRKVPPIFRLMFKHFIAIPGSILYNKMQTGDLVYRVYRLLKT